MNSIERSQLENKGTLLPRPDKVNPHDTKLYETVGVVANEVSRFLKANIKCDDGVPLMRDPLVNEVSCPFNEKMGSDTNFMAFSV